ncbi:hypothetical protein HY641_02415 [Candidatus Woesearchaeota archaeon]|nr:hypothetical protein [Candidatus Woesearchaeota archaeon]
MTGMQIKQDEEFSLVIHPHPRSETLALRFAQWKEVKSAKEWDSCRAGMKDFKAKLHDNCYVCADFCKTQFAGHETHRLVAELLRKVASHCTLAYVSDEAGYYETGDVEEARDAIDANARMIDGFVMKLKEMGWKVAGTDPPPYLKRRHF